MKDTELSHLISLGESSTLQFKRGWSDNNEIAKEVIAFANSRGGDIVFGVDDKTGNLLGLSYQEIQDISSRVANVANENVVPAIYVDTESVELDGKMLLVVHVPRGLDKPYKTLQGQIFKKQGPDKRVIKTNNQILRLFNECHNYHPDQEGVKGTSIEDLNQKALDGFFYRNFQKKKEDFDMPLDRLYRNLKITNEKGELTMAGLLFFGNHPEWTLPQFIVKAVTFYSNDLAGTAYSDSRDLVGTLPEILDACLKYCDSGLYAVQAGRSFNTLGILEISRIALEEVLQNALVHRTYLIDAPIRLLIFKNRVEIVSPGCLPEEISVDEMKLGNSCPRNPLLASFCAKTMSYRGLGSGVIRALKEDPTIEFINDEGGDKFTVIFHRTYDPENPIGFIPSYYTGKDYPMDYTENPHKTAQKEEKYTENTTQREGETTQSGEKYTESTAQSGDETTQKEEKYTESTTQRQGETTQTGEVHTENTTQSQGDTTQRLSELQKKVLQLIKTNPYISRTQIKEILSSSSIDGIKYTLKVLQQRGFIRRAGPDFGGFWEILIEID